MSRGGRGGNRGRGGRRNGPNIEYDDEKQSKLPASTEPEPLFPDFLQITPKPLSPAERASVNEYRRFRDLMRDGPLYTVLEPSNFMDRDGKVNRRAGMDPFEGMPTYINRYKKPKRTLPNLSNIPYVLEFFPQELWSTLDPKKISPEWKTVSSKKNKGPGIGDKRKREDLEDENEDDGEGDVIAPGRKKRPKKRDDPTKQKGQKQGLEAEDDLGSDVDERVEDADVGDDPEQDSDFSESDDGAHDDYNAETYFDDGEGDDLDDGGGADEDVF